MKTATNITFIDTLDKINGGNWPKHVEAKNPFEQYAFLTALEKSQSVSSKQGWTPHHLISTDACDIKAIMPMYLKSHPWGEYVFDWDWAEVFRQHGVEYYPKLVATTPFTPVTSKNYSHKRYNLTN